MWTNLFLTDQRIQLIIDGHDNKDQEIETRILQSSSILSKFFLIYISRVFDKMTEAYDLVTFLSFIDDLGFIILDISINWVVKIIEKVAKTILEKKIFNAVTYDISKIETLLFSKLHRQQLNKRLRKTKI